MKIPDIVETIVVLAAYKRYADSNEGDAETVDILQNMTADILGITPEQVTMLVDNNEAVIEIINAED